MDPETKAMLQESLELSRENNKMLHKIRSVQKWAAFWSFLKWIVIIGLTFGSLYLLQPYVNKLIDTYNSISGVSTQLKGFSMPR